MTSQTRPEALTWTALPAEIRCMILNTIANQKHPGWASFASVCREWQHVLEKANFRKMKLGVPCLDDFKHIATPQKREIIQHICLDIELPRYTSRCCSTRRSPSARISSIVTAGIHKLFDILNTWTPANDLALELNVYSPSDCEHWFRNIYLSSDDVEHDENTDALSSAWKIGRQFHDPQHGWQHGQQVTSPPKTAIQRLFRPILLDYLDPRPAQAVTCLIIRRQLRRCLDIVGLACLLRKLGRLQHMIFEPWAPLGDSDKIFRDLVVFEDSSELYDYFPKRKALSFLEADDICDPGERLDAGLASKSLGLQQLAASFIVDAEDLFRHCQSTWHWPNLQSLALTSQLLQEDWEKREKLEALLCQASILVRKMPKLHTFVLWNGGKGHAFAFVYSVDRGSASVTWRGTWHFNLSPRVVKSWQLAASGLPRSHCSELEVKHEDIHGVVTSHGDAIYRLKLPCQVIDPASLWQIRREAYS
ncbi:hypothetical protein PG984_004892 [Apiospora sp. TS-2023a]